MLIVPAAVAPNPVMPVAPPAPSQRMMPALWIAPAVAKAAMDSGVATKPIADFDAYVTSLTGFVYQSGIVMKPSGSSP